MPLRPSLYQGPALSGQSVDLRARAKRIERAAWNRGSAEYADPGADDEVAELRRAARDLDELRAEARDV